MSGGEFTRWAIIASGEGGGRIASQFFERTENPGIDDRILLMNTNRADIRNNINRVAQNVSIDQQEINTKYTVDFGPKDGSGNKFHWGEENIRQDESRVINEIEAAEIDESDAFLFLTTLGGGTGCGSVPYLIHSLRENPPSGSFRDISHVTLAVWPFEYEGAQMHFNAVAGLSRLLNWYDGQQTSDIVLLADNTHLSQEVAEDLVAPSRAGSLSEKDLANQSLVNVIDMMIAAGRETFGVTDVIDIMAWPAQRNNRHITPGLALDMETIYDLEMPFDRAAENTFVPMDPTTAEGVIAIVRAPRAKIGNKDQFTETGVKKALNNWLEKNGFDKDKTLIMNTLTPSDEKTNTYDVMLLFTGFDVTPLLDRSMPRFDMMLEGSRDGQFMSKFENPMKEYSRQDFTRLKQNLEDYLSK
jgi:cell division GTPase FtsZ